MSAHSTRDPLAGLVLLFNTVAHPDRAARLHMVSCSMTNTAKGRGRTTKSFDPVQDEIDDLNERGFPVKACRCVPAESAAAIVAREAGRIALLRTIAEAPDPPHSREEHCQCSGCAAWREARR